VHAKLGRKNRESRRLTGGIGASWDPFHPLEKNAALHIAMLISVKNVAASGEYPSRDAGDEAGLIGAVEQGYVGGLHGVKTV